MARSRMHVQPTMPAEQSAVRLRSPAMCGLRIAVLILCVPAAVIGGRHGVAAETPGAAASRPLPSATHLRTPAAADSSTEDVRRLYVTGMVGSSLASHGGSDAPSMVAGGLLAGGLPAGDGALGVAIPRGFGDVRLEFEGRSGMPSAASDGASGDSWSVMANVWRDLPITDHLGGYVGGGVGAAGLPTAGGTRGGVAGQAGAGLTYAAHDRLTFDVGYRLHAATDGRTLPAGGTALASSELLLSVRIYDPFRSWSR